MRHNGEMSVSPGEGGLAEPVWEHEWEELVWWVKYPTFSTLPEGRPVAYVPGLRISARSAVMAARASAEALTAPRAVRGTFHRVANPKEWLRAATWVRSAHFFGVRKLLEPDGRAAPALDLAAVIDRPPAKYICSADEARANCVTVIITQDRAEQLAGAIDSALGKLSDHVVVIDGGSVDDSVEVARAAGAHVVQHPFGNDFAGQRNFASDVARAEYRPRWIAVVDSDEVVTPELADLFLWVMRRSGDHDVVYGPAVTVAGEERLDSLDYRPMLYRPSMRWVGAGNERITSVRPLWLPIGGPMILNLKTRAQFLRSRLLYADLRPGAVPDDVLAATREELAEITGPDQPAGSVGAHEV